MNLTNKYNLPEAVVRAVKNDDYGKDKDWDISVTQLIKPPQMVWLQRSHADKIVDDVSDRVFMLWGQALHVIIERAAEPGAIVEQRFYHHVRMNSGRPLVVAGQVDHYIDGVITDYKTTSVTKLSKALAKDKDTLSDWTAQLSLLAFLMEKSGHPVNEARVVAFGRDWRKTESANQDNYPPAVVEVPLELDPLDKIESMFETRVSDHFCGDNPRPCTDKERWKRPDKWALMKRGGKRAVRLYDTEALAQDVLDVLPDKNKHCIELRPAIAMRCKLYCNVAAFCPQFQGEK